MQNTPAPTNSKLAELMERAPDIPIDEDGVLVLQNIKSVFALASVLHATRWLPNGIDSAEKAAVCILTARSAGIDPIVALQNTAVINNRPTFYGDLPLGICQSRKGITVDEWFELDGVRLDRRPPYTNPKEYPLDFTAVCEVSDREGKVRATETFSIADAQYAQLFPPRKGGPWLNYTWRMLKFRARAFALRMACADVMMGFDVFEEFDDLPEADFEIVAPTAAAFRGKGAEEPEAEAEEARAEHETDKALDACEKMVRSRTSIWDAESFATVVTNAGFMPSAKRITIKALFEELHQSADAALVGRIRKVLEEAPELVHKKAEAPAEPERVPAAVPSATVPANDGTLEAATRLEIIGLIDKKKLSRADLHTLLTSVFDAEELADLSQASGEYLLRGVRTATIWDHTAMATEEDDA